ncbi:protein virilizer [Scaptodrosophila lebanonensis]|uniref:Protein virilizer n=1 Tax=Drosophila lebanonensis TaxID=7225 RepID=A0A6J2UIE2_DROLE|nr:protein virilizer [Scaptodrosophila lebanonensis]
MTEADDGAELVFFDTFSHEEVTDINLDLVQFPKPVFITQVRIIPLGARVQADFPGGVRLGATNPSKFDLEFFVNDLGMPGASAFENLGVLRYNQNDCIHLDCSQEKIPTDGLVLRGWYSTITLAVYGILTNSVTEPIASPTLPCEPAAPEMCNLSGETRQVLLEDEVLKDEWSEPMATELLAHKTSVSDYEHDDIEYGIPREHYHQHAEDDQRDIRRLRRSTHSTDHSPPPARTHSHSESNEREYLRCPRDKARDWSRSPEYSSRRSRRKRSERSRSDAEDHKWPRTPPASIDSPTRPRSPDTMEYDDEDTRSHYKMQTSHVYRHSSESLHREDEERSGTPQEQFEPILSDDEIIGDDEEEDDTEDAAAAAEYERELEAAAATAPPAIDAFEPWQRPLLVYKCDLHAHYKKELDNLRLQFKKLSVQTKCENVTAFNEEHGVTVDEREQFVYLGEQLNNQLGYLTLHYKRRNYVLDQFFKNDDLHLRQAANILKIALSFQAACMQPQPAFKIRHIKLGARMAELLCNNVLLFQHLLKEHNFDAFEAVFKLYHEPYMALSIKLQLLKAVYSMLDTETGIKHFLNSKINGYSMIIQSIKTAKLTRTKYALQAIIKKLHLYEALKTVRLICSQLFLFTEELESDKKPLAFQHIEYAFEMLMDALAANSLSYQQPRRFLPVSKKFEVVTDPSAQRSFGNALQSYLKQHCFAESLLVILSNSKELPPTTFLCTIDLMHVLLRSHVGIDYFVDDAFDVTQLIVAILLGLDEVPAELKTELKKEEEEEGKEETADNPMDTAEEKEAGIKVEGAVEAVEAPKAVAPVITVHTPQMAPPKPIILRPVLPRLARLGIELAYKVQTRYHLDAIIFTAGSPENDAVKLATHMHAIYSQTCDPAGRQHTVEVLGMNNNLKIFMDLIKKEQRLQTQRQLISPGNKYKSPVLSYAVDMVDSCVRYCEQLDYLIEHGGVILELAKNHETFEPSVSAVLQEMYVYMKPLEAINVFAYDDIMPLVEVIGRSLDYLTTFPGDLIMALRILRFLATSKIPVPGVKTQKRTNTEELKHRFVALQLYAADGVQLLIQILERLCTYFEQPGLHAPALMTIQGVHCSQILLPTLQILRELLTYAILCRDGSFKDLTAVDHLVKVYFLLYYYPTRCQAGAEVEQCKLEVVQTLLAYTQPHEQDEESLHKSLWTQMIREVLKNIDGPANFIPGLKLMAELLPLPLPMPQPLADQLQQQHKQRLITERKLWSAHLHPQSGQIAKLVEALAPSSFPQLSELLQRVCMQLSDLAPNMTLLIAKTITELLCNEYHSSNCIPTTNLERLLRFSTRLCAFAPLKSSMLSILSGKFWDLFQSLLAMNEFNEVVSKCQEAVHRILDSFLDSGISLISHKSTAPATLNLAAALPPKELIPRIIDAVFSNLTSVEVTHGISILAVRNLVILTEHDYTFYHMALLLKQKITEFQAWMERVILHNENVEYNANIESLILLLRSLTQIEPPPMLSAMPHRTLKLGATELAQLVEFQDMEIERPPVLTRILTVLEKHKAVANEAALCDLKQLIALLASKQEPASTEPTGVVSTEQHIESEPISIAANIPASNPAPLNVEPFLPQAEGIVTQYEARPIFTRFCATAENAQLTARYWLDPLPIEVIEDMNEPLYERIACDLTDLANACLNPDLNLTGDCKRVLHLSGSPQSSRELTPTASCFRTRRVEVEPATGRPEKKMFITAARGRGFARPPPSRGDLFRSRPPNTSRPPSLHVDDFLALETCGAQPTGPTGYNKIPSMLRGSRVGRNRGSRISAAAAFRQKKLMRIGSPSSWSESTGTPYRSSTSESHFGSGDSHYASVPHYSSRPRGRGLRSRPSYLR